MVVAPLNWPVLCFFPKPCKVSFWDIKADWLTPGDDPIPPHPCQCDRLLPPCPPHLPLLLRWLMCKGEHFLLLTNLPVVKKSRQGLCPEPHVTSDITYLFICFIFYFFETGFLWIVLEAILEVFPDFFNEPSLYCATINKGASLMTFFSSAHMNWLQKNQCVC